MLHIAYPYLLVISPTRVWMLIFATLLFFIIEGNFLMLAFCFNSKFYFEEIWELMNAVFKTFI